MIVELRDMVPVGKKLPLMLRLFAPHGGLCLMPPCYGTFRRHMPRHLREAHGMIVHKKRGG